MLINDLDLAKDEILVFGWTEDGKNIRVSRTKVLAGSELDSEKIVLSFDILYSRVDPLVEACRNTAKEVRSET